MDTILVGEGLAEAIRQGLAQSEFVSLYGPNGELIGAAVRPQHATVIREFAARRDQQPGDGDVAPDEPHIV